MQNESHPSETCLHEYLDGELDPAQCLGLEAHLSACPACMQQLAEAQVLFASLEALPELSLEHDLAPGVLAALSPRPERRSFNRPLLFLTFAAQLVIAALLVTLAWPLISLEWSRAWAILEQQALVWVSQAGQAWLVEGQAVVEAAGARLAQFYSTWLGWAQGVNGLQFPLFGLVGLLATASLVWLVANRLLLRPNGLEIDPFNLKRRNL